MIKVIALVLVAVVGCGTSDPVAADASVVQVDAPPQVNAKGTWTLSDVYAIDSCGHPGSTTSEMIVVGFGAYGYNATVTAAAGTSYGSVDENTLTLTCTTASCMMAGTFQFTGDKQTYTFTLLADHTITGSGSDLASSCTATFTASGTFM